jgi:hypothetical protein
VRNYILLGLLFCSLASSPALAVKEGGGGDGYVASFVTVARHIEAWLEIHGKELNPSVDFMAFDRAVDPNKIGSTDSQLYYKGLPKDCLFDLSSGIITINRARWSELKDGSSEQTRVVAHELFRKMGIEGDGYEVSTQIMNSLVSAVVAQLKQGDFASSDNDPINLDQGMFTSYGSSLACVRHVETDPQNNLVVIEMKSAPNGTCFHAGTVVSYTCSSTTGPQCAMQNPYNGGTEGLIIKYFEKLTILPDGNFAVDEWSVMPPPGENDPIPSGPANNSTKFHFLAP